MPRLPFRLTPRSAIELGLALLLALVGLILILGTTDEYQARKAFNRAMDNYVAGVFEDVQDGLEAAMQAKPAYSAPREAFAKLLVDDGYKNPAKFAEARSVFQELQRRQEAAGGRASLPTLVGLAVADLEAIRARDPKPEALAAALSEARTRLEAALATHPNSGDVHVNLATVALLVNDTERCKAELAKVVAAGNISPDALPVLYNLNGLVGLREQLFNAATAEFEKVKEFKPDWEVPQLNIGAAYARILIAPDADPRLADRAVAVIRKALPIVQKSKGLLYGLICQALASYYADPRRTGFNPTETISYLAQAEKLGKLPWQSRFNRAVAQYFNLTNTRRRLAADAYAPAMADLAEALAEPKAGAREKFVASCLLGTLAAEQDKRQDAIAHFERAVSLAAGFSHPLLATALSRAHISLASLYYESGQPLEAIKHFDQATDIPDALEKQRLDALLKHLHAAPVIAQFEARPEKLFTDYDLAVSAVLTLPGSPKPLAPECVSLSLEDTLSNTARPLPFQLNGPILYAVAVNLPQGRYRVKLVLTDSIGNRAEAASPPVEFDRAPPFLVKRTPEAGATVASLKSIEFTVEDALSSVDLDALRVMLRYPLGSSLASRTLVSNGKYQFPSADGSIARLSPITSHVRAPVPADKLLKGEYHVSVHVQDSKGKARDIEWAFTLAP